MKKLRCEDLDSECLSANEIIKVGSVHYMTDDALLALQSKSAAYPYDKWNKKRLSACRDIYHLAEKMNKIPNMLFCEEVTAVWREECERRAMNLPPLE